MKKLKYQGGITKLLMSRRGKKNKERFANLSIDQLQAMVQGFEQRKVAMEVASLSSTYDFYEQMLSILSYQRFVGIPLAWTVYSDGSHTAQEISDLETLFPYVKVAQTDLNDPAAARKDIKEKLVPYFDDLLHYAQNSPYGKKLFYYLNHKIENPTLFIDSDILFYKLASVAFKEIENEDKKGWFLPDQVWGCLDSRYKSKYQPQPYQINSGFFLVNNELDNLHNGMVFLNSVQKKYENFTEQTVFHILFKANEFFPFDPRIFFLSSDDQFDFSYGFNKNAMAMRHYTGPVRHKMWQRDWKWQLSL